MTREEFIDKTSKAVFEANAQSCEIWDQIKEKSETVSPCDKCPNNPMNNPNASVFCNCAAPYFSNPIKYEL